MRIDRVKFVTALTVKDMSLKRLCELSRVSRATVTAVKSGKTCSEETGRKIAAALEIDIEQLIAREGQVWNE